MEDAVVSYAEGIATALVGKLGQLLAVEYRLLGSVRGGVVHLRGEVAIMNAVLRMLAETDDCTVNHFVREWMKQVRELAYDAEDCIDLFVRRISCVPRGTSALGGAWHLLITLSARHRLASDIEDLRARALAVSECRARYGVHIQELHPSAYFAPSAVVTSSTMALGAANNSIQFVGIEGQVKTLSEKVSDDTGPNKELKVFSVVGFGGLGKTTLAMEVCRRLEEKFVCQAKVSVSQAFDASKDMSGRLKQILQQLMTVNKDFQKSMQVEESVGNIGDMDVEWLTSKLRDFLGDKRYLIMIDDVWTIKAWNEIRARLPENNQNSRVIVTTRIQTVANACSSGEDSVYQVKYLELKDSEELFVNRVFGPNVACPTELEEAKNSILRKCGGVPLAIVSIASLLASYKSPGSTGMWNRVSSSIGSQMESNPTLEGMRQLITLSYNHLPHPLKACMMYLSIFPEDYMVSKDRLLKRWIAEGLVPEMRGLTSEEVAEASFDELLSRNMMKPSQIEYDGRVVTCCVHDMMLEVIVSKSLEENFVSLVGSQFRGTSYDSVRRLSIQGDDPRFFVHEMGMRHVRSLTTFRLEGHKLLDRLPEFVLLRVLDLEDCKDLQDHHMKHVCQLLLLRFLSLKRTDITVLPREIGKLLHLQTLWLDRTLLDGVPDSVIKLEKLENFYFSNREYWFKLLRLPLGLRKMKVLDGLYRLQLGEDDAELTKEIGDLVKLRKLHVVLNFNDCDTVLQELASSIGRCRLHELSVQDMVRGANNMKFLHEIRSPPLLISYLNIGGTINKLPDWLESLRHLTHIELWWIDLHGDEIYGVLCKLPKLMKISLDRNCCKDEELVARTAFKFHVLREMLFGPYGSGQDNPRVLRFEKGAMERLERLSVTFDNLTRNLVGVENLTSLREVQLEGVKGNRALHSAVDQLKAESSSREESNRFKVLLKYTVADLGQGLRP